MMAEWQAAKKIDSWSLPLDLVQDFGHEQFLSHTYHHICGPVSDQIVWILNHYWPVLSDEQMSNGYPFSLLNDEQMSK